MSHCCPCHLPLLLIFVVLVLFPPRTAPPRPPSSVCHGPTAAFLLPFLPLLLSHSCRSYFHHLLLLLLSALLPFLILLLPPPHLVTSFRLRFFSTATILRSCLPQSITPPPRPSPPPLPNPLLLRLPLQSPGATSNLSPPVAKSLGSSPASQQQQQQPRQRGPLRRIFREFRLLFGRVARQARRDMWNHAARGAASLILGVAYGATNFRLGSSQNSVKKRASMMFQVPLCLPLPSPCCFCCTRSFSPIKEGNDNATADR